MEAFKTAAVELLSKNPLLLLFAIAAIGYPIGRIKVAGAHLGIAALLFVGIAFGAWDPRLKLPEAFFQFGLALFVYTIGLSTSPGFFAAFTRKGVRTNALSIGIIFFGGLSAVALLKLFQLGTPWGVGLFCGTFTNSPALAAAIETAKATLPPGSEKLPVVAYAIGYPFGVVGPLLAILAVKRLCKIDLKAESAMLPPSVTGHQTLAVRSVRLTNPEAVGTTSELVRRMPGLRLVFGRVRRGDTVFVPKGDTPLEVGDEITVVATPDDLDAATAFLGDALPHELSHDHTEFDFRRIFVSNVAVTGKPIRDLELPQRYGAIITRIRRGDRDFIPTGETILEPGDRVRVTCRREVMPSLTHLFGDSYKNLSEVDLLNFSLGMAIGLALGAIPFPLPGGLTFKLGFAGGPLIVALILGRFHRTGNIVWDVPYSANLTIRQLGLMLYAAGVGTLAGERFGQAFTQGQAVPIMGAAALITFFCPFLLLMIGYKGLKMPFSTLMGVLSGANTQPVVLSFSADLAKNDAPHSGYAQVFPFATIFKLVFAQLLVLFIR